MSDTHGRFRPQSTATQLRPDQILTTEQFEEVLHTPMSTEAAMQWSGYSRAAIKKYRQMGRPLTRAALPCRGWWEPPPAPAKRSASKKPPKRRSA